MIAACMWRRCSRSRSRWGGCSATGPSRVSAAIAAVTTVAYLGSFTGPPLVGALAEAGSLTAALGLLVAVSGAVVLLEPRVPG
jgi:hypothetical protein